jgi:hypothetical protein
VQDLAGLLVREGLVHRALVAGEEPQRAAGDLGLEGQHLERRDQAVAAERGHVPRDAGVGKEALRRVGEEHVQVGAGALEPVVEVLVARLELGGPMRQSLAQGPPVLHHLSPRQRVGWGAGLHHGRDRDGDLGTTARRHREPVLRGRLVEGRGRGVKPELRGPDDAIQPAVGQADGPVVALGRERIAPTVTGQPAHLEHVAEIGGEVTAQHQLVRLAGKVLDRQPLVQLPAVEGQPAGQPERAPQQGDLRARAHIGGGEIDHELERVCGDRSVQRQGPLAVHAQFEIPKEARALDVEAELAVAQARKVAPTVCDEEALVVLEDQLRQVRRDARG